MISIAPTTCSRSYRTAQVSWPRRLCKSRTAPSAAPWHENHARGCVSLFLCGSDSRSGFHTVLHFVVANKPVLRFVVKIDFKIICGSDKIRPQTFKIDFEVICVGFASVGEWLWYRGRFRVVSCFVVGVCTRKLAAKSRVNLIHPRLS